VPRSPPHPSWSVQTSYWLSTSYWKCLTFAHSARSASLSAIALEPAGSLAASLKSQILLVSLCGATLKELATWSPFTLVVLFRICQLFVQASVLRSRLQGRDSSVFGTSRSLYLINKNEICSQAVQLQDGHFQWPCSIGIHGLVSQAAPVPLGALPGT
jgi:hypothetical protein